MAKVAPKPAPVPLAPGITVAVLAVAVVLVVLYLTSRRDTPPDGGLHLVDEWGGNDGGQEGDDQEVSEPFSSASGA